MSYSYIFPNDEEQWDEVGYGSSSDDPYPSSLFSAIKHNKAVPLACSIGLGEGDKFELSFTQSCNTVLLDTSHLFSGNINCSKYLPYVLVDFSRECITEASISLDSYSAFVDIKKETAITALGLTPNNCLTGKNIPDTFKKKSSAQESCVQYTPWKPPVLQEVTNCNSNNIDEAFDHGYYSPPEFCNNVTSVLITTGFSGCRSENIGLQSLPQEFGTNYVIVITCKFLPNQDKSDLASVCPPYLSSEYNSINGGTQVFGCNALTQQFTVGRICNLFINATAPLIQYGRINSMVMMPAFRDYGRISG